MMTYSKKDIDDLIERTRDLVNAVKRQHVKGDDLERILTPMHNAKQILERIDKKDDELYIKVYTIVLVPVNFKSSKFKVTFDRVIGSTEKLACDFALRQMNVAEIWHVDSCVEVD